MRLILLIQDSCRNIWDISTSITFPSNIDLEVLDTKSLLKILEEIDKVLGCLFLSFGSNLPDGEASADWLIDPTEVNSSS